VIKISYVMNVLNGEPFIKFQLDSIYKHAYEIIIIEGAYVKFSHASSPEGRSLDSTIELIENYPDIENKITLVTKPGFFSSRLAMCNEFFEYVTGDVIWQVDVDEFYLDSTHSYVAQLFNSDNDLDRVCFNFYDFFGSFDYYIKGYENIGLDNIRRVHRYNKGEIWSDQRPPTLSLDTKEKSIRRELSGNEMELEGHMMFHPTMLFDSQVKDKYKYYSSRSSSISKPNTWITHVWLNYNNKLNVAGIKNYITYLETFKNGLYPKSLIEMYSSIKNGDYEGYNVRKMQDVENFMNSSSSEIYKEIIEDLFQNLYIKSSKSSYLSLFKIIYRASLKLDMYSFSHLIRVIIIHVIRKKLNQNKINDLHS
jgi:hypothetical protein